jgi:hypothetical protein
MAGALLRVVFLGSGAWALWLVSAVLGAVFFAARLRGVFGSIAIFSTKSSMRSVKNALWLGLDLREANLKSSKYCGVRAGGYRESFASRAGRWVKYGRCTE